MRKSAPRHRQRPQGAAVAPEGFRRARKRAGLDVEQCAQLLRVDPRTVRNWEAGRTSTPYSAYRLLRVESGQRLPGEAWRGWMLINEHLVAPTGQRFSVHDMIWLSLSFRRSEAFGALYAKLSAMQATRGMGRSPIEAAAHAPSPAARRAARRVARRKRPPRSAEQIGARPGAEVHGRRDG